MTNRRKKKKFFDTGVGSVLKIGASLLAPNLVAKLEGVKNVQEALGIIKDDDETPAEAKVRLQEMALEQYNAEVQDRASARHREALVAASGGNDVMFKIIGGGTLLIWAFLLYALFLGGLEVTGTNRELMILAFGAVSADMRHIVAYYYGSSMGSKQKSSIMNKLNE